MAESVSGAGEAPCAFRPFHYSPSGGEFFINISNKKVDVASPAEKEACKSITTLGALYFRFRHWRPIITTAIQEAFGGERDDQEVEAVMTADKISLNVQPRFFTDERFLEVLADYKSGRIQERLQEKFSQVGIQVEELKVEIANMEEVYETMETINTRNFFEDVENAAENDVENDENQLQTAMMKPLPCSEEALTEEAISLGLFEAEPNLKKPRAKLLHCIYSSMKIGRSINHVSFLLVGTSGVGKSATVNHLLGVNLAKTSKKKSQTRSTTEYMVQSSDPKYEVEGLSLGLVDTPGSCDTDGSKQDACNFLCIKRFFRTHPTLSKCYPNLIFLVVRATDNRIMGENSEFGKALRCLNQLCLVDPENPNVVVILTHVCSIRKKNNKKWIKELEEMKSTVSKMVFDDLKVHAPVMLIENKYDDCGLERRGDYTRLPNGELQPKKLYLTCAKVLLTNYDNLGLITLNRIFANANNKNKKHAKPGHKQKATNAKKSTLDSEEETMAEFLKLAAERGFKDPFYTVILEYINEQKLDGENAEEAMRIAGVLKHLGEGNPPTFGSHSIHSVEFFLGKEISSSGREMLQKKFNIDIAMKPSCSALESGRLIGQGYNILTDEAVTTAQVMNFEVTTNCNNIAKPTCAKFEKVLQSTSLMEVFKDNASYTKSRLRRLHVNLDVQPDTFKMDCRAGYNMQNDSSSSSSASEYSFLFERRLFEVKLGNYKEHLNHGMTFTEDFKSDVAKLPSTYDKSDPSCVSEFERFFNRFGHFLVSSAYGGGSVEVKCSREAVGSTKMSLSETKACLAATLEGKGEALSEQSTYSWNGGEVALQANESIGDKKKFQKWKNSLIVKPVMLTSELTLEPISTAVGCVDSQKDQATYDALKDLLGSEIKIFVKKEKKSITDHLRDWCEKVKSIFTRGGTIVPLNV